MINDRALHPLAPPSRAGGGAALSLYLFRKERIPDSRRRTRRRV